MGIRGGLYNMGARLAKGVSSSRTVGRSVGASSGAIRNPMLQGINRQARSSSMARLNARNMYPMSRVRTMGNRSTRSGLGAVRGGVTARSIGSRATRSGLGGIAPGSIRGTPGGAMRFPTASSALTSRGIRPGSGSIGRQANGMMDALRPGATAARRSRTRRAVGWAAKNPLVVGGSAAAIGFNAGRQDTGPGITTTNTTGMYQY